MSAPTKDSREKLILEILHFWFGKDSQEPLSQQSHWWQKDSNFDEEIRKTFGELVEQARADQLEEWGETAKGSLALVILIDQFSRNLFRNSGEAFRCDAKALEISQQAIARGLDQKLSLVERWFLYMPFMHSEDPQMQKISLKLYSHLSHEAPAELKKALTGAYDFAQRHAEIIFRFGRYPHRNAVLGRRSTTEEINFLKEPQSSF